MWSASLTAAGEHYLAVGDYPPDVTSKARPTGNTGDDQMPSTDKRPQASSAAAPLAPAVEPVKIYRTARELVAAVVEAGGALMVQRVRPGAEDWHYSRLVESANRGQMLPAGKQLVTRVVTWPGMSIWMSDKEIIPGADVTLRPVPVPSRVSKYHTVAITFRNLHRPDLAKGLLPRATRIVHAVATEAERRGYAVSMRGDVSGYVDSRTRRRNRSLIITVNGHPQQVRIYEEGFSSSKPSGRLRIDVNENYAPDYRKANWADRKSWTLDDKLPEVLREVETQAAEAEHRKRQRERQEQQKRERWEAAMAQAKLDLAEHHRAEILRAQANRWFEVHRLNEYINAMEAAAGLLQDPVEAEEAHLWLAWARQYTAKLNPLNGHLALPEAPEAKPDALRPFLKGWSPYGPSGHH
ncbi:hypothetical protein LO762_14535 [Actinocorallia sp. API 0066]|uniref:hypothetical protein n=1 Tax=Actinocorallia sp. API 0066 TaxID=2896846 RepID=UPI001E3987AB|nr:hypothetical protein [Actinocorallia sp. API 0066]MCD0450400.1 hypothetical protein [Actinocorallia sp. API 0066]